MLVVHYDGKTLKQFHDQIHSVKKRSVIVTSPDLESDQVLAVPITPSNSGKNQKEVIMNTLNDWDLSSQVFGLGFDTTSDNTGKYNGSAVLIEKSLGEAVLWVACPHHFYELHVKKAARMFYGETNSPEENIYKTLKSSWNDIEIDYDDLDLFDWHKAEGTCIADQAKEVLVFYRSLLENNTFPREDLKELLSLVLVWLGEKVDGFKFQTPGALSHARFLMQAIYSMKISLLSNQLDIYSQEDLAKVKSVAQFVGLYHAYWYFKSPVAVSAPVLHLSTISQMKKLEVILPDLAGVVLKSIFAHLWYLSPQWVPLAIADESLPSDQRSNLAVTLSNIPRPETFPLGKPSFPDLSEVSDNDWSSGRVPNLSSLLGPESWLIFDKLELTESDLKWLSEDPQTWDIFPGFIRFQNIMKKLTIVNDPAERGVGLVKDFIATFQSESLCQKNLLAVSGHRKIVKKNSKKSDLAKIGLH